MSKRVVRPILAAERKRFDRALEAEHWLGARLVGEVMRYVAIEDGQWCALVGFGASALYVRSREALLGWSDDQRHRRLRFITNNQRFCVLAAGRRPNLASEVLGLTLRRLSADFEARWGHPVVAVETFTDPALHVGTCYKASNFTALGTTSGYGRRSGRFVYHGAKKLYWSARCGATWSRCSRRASITRSSIEGAACARRQTSMASTSPAYSRR